MKGKGNIKRRGGVGRESLSTSAAEGHQAGGNYCMSHVDKTYQPFSAITPDTRDQSKIITLSIAASHGLSSG